MHSSLLSWRDRYFKKLKDISQNAQNKRYGGKSNHIYKTYKNTVMPHGRLIYAKAYDMEKATMCAKSHYNYVLPHWKCVLQFLPNVLALIFLTSKHMIRIPSQSFNLFSNILSDCTL